MQDKEIKCACGKTFPFTKGEQQFFKEKGFDAPKRCKDCQKKKKEERSARFTFNYDNAPFWGQLTARQWQKMVDEDSFPICSSCENPIFNPGFYPDDNGDMCGPCTTGESDTLLQHSDEFERFKTINGMRI